MEEIILDDNIGENWGEKGNLAETVGSFWGAVWKNPYFRIVLIVAIGAGAYALLT